jgi:hypothetical protein
MSKEGNNDRLSLSGTAVNYQRAPHHNQNIVMRHARIAWLCLFGLIVVSVCVGTNGVYFLGQVHAARWKASA